MALALALCGTFYSIIAWLAVRRPIPAPAGMSEGLPPVTILKPLYGAEPETYECLRSFCEQRYPRYQIVFGVAEASDPVVAIVERLQREYPHQDLHLSVDRRQHGSNRKVSNLINMMPLARHEMLVLADGDVRVNADYLARVVGPLSDKSVGIVTCTYRGCPRTGFWPMLGSLFINDWFIPSVRVAAFGGSRSFAFGATIAMRRAVLSSIGGFKSIANQLADDFRLGELTRQMGLSTVLSDVVVDTMVPEVKFSDLVRHELRWLRTIRAVNPLGFAFFFLTFSFPVAALDCVLAHGSQAAIAMLLSTTMARCLLHLKTRGPDSHRAEVLLLPWRDCLSLGLWGLSFLMRRVRWRDAWFDVARDGSVRLVESV